MFLLGVLRNPYLDKLSVVCACVCVRCVSPQIHELEKPFSNEGYDNKRLNTGTRLLLS